MSQTIPNGAESAPSATLKPPALAYKTLKNFVESFRTAEAIPTHIDKSMLPGTMSGGNQVYVISALKFLGLISGNGATQQGFHDLAKLEGPPRVKALQEIIKSAYAFLLKDIDIERTTTKVVVEKFKDEGLGGDTIRKAISFFQAIAKDAEMKISPHIKTSLAKREVKPTRTRRAAPIVEGEPPEDEEEEQVRYEAPRPAAAKSEYQVLIDILSPDMEEEEQSAVWTLIRYLKRREAEEDM